MLTNIQNFKTNTDRRLTGFPLKITKVISNFSDEINEFNSVEQIINLFGISNPAEKFEFELNNELAEIYKFSKNNEIDSARLVYEIGYLSVAYQIYLDLLRLLKREISVLPADLVNEQKGFTCFFKDHFKKNFNYDDFDYYSETANSEVPEWLSENIKNFQTS